VILIDGQMGAIASLPIAQTPAIASGQMSYQLQSIEVGPAGTSYGTPQGSTTVAYNPQAKTITVTLTASGLTPGTHAAHIHVGSCASQGPVQYMLMDFEANGQGQIVNQVRTVTGVTMPVPATGWYLNLHQGNSNNIVANGQPTVNFRPLLCANVWRRHLAPASGADVWRLRLAPASGACVWRRIRHRANREPPG
jgi:CHRD domain